MKTLSSEQIEQLRLTKSHFPFRYCFAALNPETGDFQTHAVYNYPARKMRKLADKGYLLFEFEKPKQAVS